MIVCTVSLHVASWFVAGSWKLCGEGLNLAKIGYFVKKSLN